MNNCTTIDDIRRIYKRKFLDKFYQPYFPLLCALYSKQMDSVENDETHRNKDDVDFVVKIVNTAGYDLNTSFVQLICGMYYDDMKLVDLKNYYLMAIEQGNSFAMLNMGNYYTAETDYELTKKYYLMAIKLGNSDAMFSLGLHYHMVGKDYELMKKYYLMAIERGNSDAMCNLGYHYENVEKHYKLMKKYYLMAIKHGESDAMCNLGNYYHQVERDYELMKKYYLMAIKLGKNDAMYGLGVYYHLVEKDYELMKKYYLMAINHGNSDAMCNLGFYYHKVEKDYELMKKYYLMAIVSGADSAVRQLVIYFKDKELMLYKVLIEVAEAHRSTKLKETLLGLEQNYAVHVFNNKVRLYKRFQNYKQCAICLEENVLNITLECSLLGFE